MSIEEETDVHSATAAELVKRVSALRGAAILEQENLRLNAKIF